MACHGITGYGYNYFLFNNFRLTEYEGQVGPDQQHQVSVTDYVHDIMFNNLIRNENVKN